MASAALQSSGAPKDDSLNPRAAVTHYCSYRSFVPLIRPYYKVQEANSLDLLIFKTQHPSWIIIMAVRLTLLWKFS